MSERASSRVSARPDLDVVKDLGIILKVVLCFKTFWVKVTIPGIPMLKEKLMQMGISGMTISAVSGRSKHSDGIVFVRILEEAFNIITLGKGEKVLI